MRNRRRMSSLMAIVFLLTSVFGSIHTAFASEGTVNTLGVKKLAAGTSHILMLENDGTVWTWGTNYFNELGYETFSNVSGKAGKVPGLENVKEIDASTQFSMAVKEDGTVWTWGYNSEGQLGDGTKENSKAPIKVQGLSGITSISGGGQHSLALKEDGTVWAWGRNSAGQLGDGTRESRLTPVQVKGLSDVIAIDAGGDHNLALKSDGTVYTWGLGSEGWVNDALSKAILIPVKVEGLSGIKAVKAGRGFSLALKDDGTLWSWGVNYSGQLGDGTNNQRSIPAPISGLTDVKEMDGGFNHSLALKSDGTVWAWGSNDIGQLGIGTKEYKLAPVQVHGISDVKHITAGALFSMAVKSDGSIWGWGHNAYGQLADDTYEDKLMPAKAGVDTGNPEKEFINPKKIVNLEAGGDYSLGLRADGRVYIWGSLNPGHLGNGTEFSKQTFKINTPFLIPDFGDVKALSAGKGCALALKKDGTVYGWGYNIKDGQQIAAETLKPYSSPFKVPGLSDIAAVSAGAEYCIALKDDGTVWMWPYEIFKQPEASLPVKIEGLGDILSISARNERYLALKNDGTVWEWDENIPEEGNLKSILPAQVKDITGASSISAGFSHNIALKKDGKVYVWGTSDPYILNGGEKLSNVIKVAAGNNYNIALLADGSVKFWGSDLPGESTSASSAIEIYGFGNIMSIAAGGNHGLYIDKNGIAFAGGDNTFGQLGVGNFYSNTIPQRIITDDGSLKVTGAVPESNSLYAVGDTAVEITFNKNIYEGPNYGNITLKNNRTSHIKKEIKGNKLTITPVNSLNYDSGYIVDIPKDSLKGEDGSVLRENFSNAFYTLKEYNVKNPPLLVKSTYPENETEIVSIISPITVTFTGEIAAGANLSSIALSDSSGVQIPGKLSFQNVTLTIQPGSSLKDGETYTVKIPSGSIKYKSSDKFLDKDYEFKFMVKERAKGNYGRYAGSDRYETAISISKSGWASSENVVLSTGEDFPDALCAAPLARSLDAPILLTEKLSLSGGVLSEIERLDAKNVYIIGGEGVISYNVFYVLKKKGLNVIRISGNDRYETSANVAKYMKDNFNISSDIVIATGENFPDALSVAPIAASSGMPILLSSSKELPESVKNYIGKDSKKAYIIGGTGVISSSATNGISGAERISGSDRYETNIAVLEKFRDKLDFNSAYIATGNNFPDALSGSSLASKTSSPIILVDKTIGQASKDYISSRNFTENSIKVLGGTGVVSDENLQAIESTRINVEGNSLPNLNNLGVAAEQGGIIYYSNFYDGGRLYSIRSDGSNNTRLCDDEGAGNINVVGRYIYYTDKEGRVKRISKDGTGKTLFVDEKVSFFYFKSGLIYYYSDGLYSMTEDGTQKTKITGPNYREQFAINGSYVYYINGGLMRVRLDGTQSDEIISMFDNVTKFNIVDNTIFYTRNDKKLYKIATNGRINYEPVIEDTIGDFNISGNWIYYINASDKNKLYKVKTDGTSRIKLSDLSLDGSINIAGNTLFALMHDTDNSKKLLALKAADENPDQTPVELPPDFPGDITKVSSYGGVAAAQGDFIYYNTSIETGGGALYKVKKDLTGKQRLSDDSPLGINVLGDWIYYSNQNDNYKLYKIRIDGTERTKLTDNVVWNVRVVGNWIYYTSDDSPRNNTPRLYRMRLDGTGKTMITDEYVMSFTISNGFIYFKGIDQYEGLHKMKLDGTGKALIVDYNIESFNVVGDWIYYSKYISEQEDNTLYKIRIDGTAETLLLSDICYNINVSGDWIYFDNGSDGRKLYRIKTDGTQKTKLNDIERSYGISIAGDWLYHEDFSRSPVFYNIKTGQEVLEKSIK